MLKTSLAFVLLFVIQAQAIIIDKIVARVNNEAITLSELNEEMETIQDELMRQFPPEKLQEELDRRRPIVLNTLIEYRLMSQKAEELGITTDKTELDRRIKAAIKQTLGRFPSKDDYLLELEKKGMTETDLEDKYRRIISEQLTFQRLNQREVRSKIKITDQETEQFFKELNMLCKIEHIFILIKPGSSPEETAKFKEKAQKIHAEAVKSSDFAAYAKKNTDSPRIYAGDESGYFRRGNLIPEVENLAYTLEVGAISEPVRSPTGFHIVKLIERKDSPFSMMVKASHILLKDQKAAEEVRQKALDGADFAELAQQFSIGPSAAKGGDLGFFKKGDMVAEFDKVVFTLKPGDISTVVQTKFGFHVIKLLETKNLDYSNQKEQLAKIIFERRIKKASFEWLNKLKENAKIEIIK